MASATGNCRSYIQVTVAVPCCYNDCCLVTTCTVGGALLTVRGLCRLSQARVGYSKNDVGGTGCYAAGVQLQSAACVLTALAVGWQHEDFRGPEQSARSSDPV